MERLKKIDNFIESVEKCFIVALFSSLIILIIINILARNIFDFSFKSIFAYAPAMVLWIALTGASIALKHRRHIKLELLLRYLPNHFHTIAELAQYCFGLIVMIILFIASIIFIKNEIAIFGLDGWISIIFPIFFSVSGFRFMIAFISAWCERSGNTRNAISNTHNLPSRDP